MLTIRKQKIMTACTLPVQLSDVYISDAQDQMAAIIGINYIAMVLHLMQLDHAIQYLLYLYQVNTVEGPRTCVSIDARTPSPNLIQQQLPPAFRVYQRVNSQPIQ